METMISTIRKKAVFFTIIALVPFLASCAGPVGQRAAQGGFIGAALGAAGGAILGGGKGAAIGAAAGAAAGTAIGAAVGSAEAKNIYDEPQPLPWLLGEGNKPKSIRVVARDGWGFSADIVLPVLEEHLKRRGAIVVSNPGPQYWPQAQPGESAATDYIALFKAVDQGGAVRLDLQVFDRAQQLKASGSHRVYYGSACCSSDFQYEALRLAAREAVRGLH